MSAEVFASRCNVAVVGGGAAGLMAALSAAMTWQEKQKMACETPPAALNKLPVVLLERQDRVGRKILATGNGRCNLSNQDLTLEHYHGCDARFASGALHRVPGTATLDFFRQIGLLCRTEPDGRIFPYSLQASAVLDLLRLAAARLGVRTLVSFEVNKLVTPVVTGKMPAGGFRLLAADGREVQADRVIMATGGLAAPALGCDSSGYELMTGLGHRLTDVFPALVQVRTETDLVRGLAGIKFEGTAWVLLDGKKICQSSGEVLFTEYGLSGPPLLDLSRTVGQNLQDRPDCQVMIGLDLLPGMPYDELLQWLAFRQSADPKAELAEYLTGLVHKKIGQALLKRCLERPLNSPVSALSAANREKIAVQLKSLQIRAVGTRDWSQAQVTAGGLDVRDFRPDTLESRLIPGLYAAGEILDIDGDCGGFNLQWAWSSGSLAGQRAMAGALAAASGQPDKISRPIKEHP